MIKCNIYKKLLLIFLLTTIITQLNAQTGLNFQGVARTTNNIIIASQDITLKLSIIRGNPTGITEYIEVRKVTTNAQGLFTTVIGDSLTISTLGKFSDIDWNLSPKFLKIEIDPTAGNNFITMGTTQFQYVAYAKFANSVVAENITGIVPVGKGGTGTNSLAGFKSNLALDKVNNTADSLKPISKSTQLALDFKLNIADSVKGYVTPAQLASYNFSSGGTSIDTTGLFNRINLKLNIADTIALLRKSDTSNLSNRINLKLNIADTIALLRKSDTSSLSNRINLKLNTTDTTQLLRKADTSTLSNRINLKLNSIDTASLFRKSQVGSFNGAASLDAVGKIPSVQIPAISFSSVDVVNDMAAMLALPTTRLVGSIAVRLDSNKNFVLSQLPASDRANWIELLTPNPPVQSVNGLTGNVDLRKARIVDLTNVDNTNDLSKPVSNATKDSLNLKLNITDTTTLLKKSDTSFLLQKVDTAAILAMYAKKFSKDVKINGTSLGKYANGAIIPAKGKTLDEFLEDLVSNSIPPSFSAPSVSIGASPGAISYEIGYDPGVVTLSSTYNKNDGGNATSTIFYKNGVSLGSGVYTNSPGALTNSVGYSVIVNYAAGTATKNDNLGTSFPNTITSGSTSASLSFSTFSKRYWGGISEPFNTSTIYDITTLSPTPNSDNNGNSAGLSNATIPISGSQYAFYAYPINTSTDLSSIMYSGQQSITAFTKTIVFIKNAQGHVQQYKVYVSNERYGTPIVGITFQ
jgi:hypothetical protein